MTYHRTLAVWQLEHRVEYIESCAGLCCVVSEATASGPIVFWARTAFNRRSFLPSVPDWRPTETSSVELAETARPPLQDKVGRVLDRGARPHDNAESRLSIWSLGLAFEVGCHWRVSTLTTAGHRSIDVSGERSSIPIPKKTKDLQRRLAPLQVRSSYLDVAAEESGELVSCASTFGSLLLEAEDGAFLGAETWLNHLL